MHRINNHFAISSIILIVFLASIPICSSAQSSRLRRTVDQSTILFLFQNQLFKSLTSKLEQYQLLYDQSYEEEDNVVDAFEVFSKVDTAYDSLFIKWIKEYSDSYAPSAARAKYYCGCARNARGSKWLIGKDQKEYKEMERYYSLALLDIHEALKNNVRSDICYAMMVEAGSMTDDEELKSSALAGALRYHPYAYRIRLKYVQTLTPRLGGSYELMQAVIDSSAKYAGFNPRLKELPAALSAEKGNVFSYLGKYEDAVKMYTETLSYSDDHTYYADRGDAYGRLHEYEKALNDYDHALKLSPNNPGYLSRKATAVAGQAEAANALKERQRAQRADSYKGRNQDQSLISERTQAIKHSEKGNNFLSAEKFEEAVAEFNEVIRLIPYEFVPYYNRAVCYVRLRNEDAALQDFLKVVELKPDYVKTYFSIAAIYANRGMYDDAIMSINKLLSLEPHNGEALFTRARIYERKGSNIEAVQDMQQACDLGYEKACRYYNQVK